MVCINKEVQSASEIASCTSQRTPLHCCKHCISPCSQLAMVITVSEAPVYQYTHKSQPTGEGLIALQNLSLSL